MQEHKSLEIKAPVLQKDTDRPPEPCWLGPLSLPGVCFCRTEGRSVLEAVSCFLSLYYLMCDELGYQLSECNQIWLHLLRKVLIYKETNMPSTDFICGWSLKAAVRECTMDLFANKAN